MSKSPLAPKLPGVWTTPRGQSIYVMVPRPRPERGETRVTLATVFATALAQILKNAARNHPLGPITVDPQVDMIRIELIPSPPLTAKRRKHGSKAEKDHR